MLDFKMIKNEVPELDQPVILITRGGVTQDSTFYLALETFHETERRVWRTQHQDVCDDSFPLDPDDKWFYVSDITSN